jgi:hypothetical protein
MTDEQASPLITLSTTDNNSTIAAPTFSLYLEKSVYISHHQLNP